MRIAPALARRLDQPNTLRPLPLRSHLPTRSFTSVLHHPTLRTASTMSPSPYQVVTTDKAPKAVGPYVIATKHNGVRPPSFP